MFWRRRKAHPRAEELSAYLDGEVRGRARDALAAHLAGCASCRTAYEELAAAKAALAALPRPAPLRSFRLSPQAAERLRPTPQPHRALAFAPAAALALFLALLAVDLGTFSSDDGAGDTGLFLRTAEEAGKAAAPQPSELNARPAAQEPDRDAAAPQPGAAAGERGAAQPSPAGGGGPVWLRVAEVAAVVLFIASAAALAWPRLRRRWAG